MTDTVGRSALKLEPKIVQVRNKPIGAGVHPRHPHGDVAVGAYGARRTTRAQSVQAHHLRANERPAVRRDRRELDERTPDRDQRLGFVI